MAADRCAAGRAPNDAGSGALTRTNVSVTPSTGLVDTTAVSVRASSPRASGAAPVNAPTVSSTASTTLFGAPRVTTLLRLVFMLGR